MGLVYLEALFLKAKTLLMPESSLAVFSQKVARWCATLTLALLPLFFIPVQWATVAHAKFLLLAVGVGVGIAALAVSRFSTGTLSVPKSLTLLAAILIPLVYLVSTLMSSDAGVSVFGYGVERDTFLTALLWFGALLLGVFGFESRGRVMWSYKVILILASLISIFQVLRLLIGADIVTFGGALSGTAASVVGSWHDLGIFLGFVIALGSAFLGSSHAQGGTRLLVMAAVALSFIGLVIVNVSDVWITLALFGFGMFLYHVWGQHKLHGTSWGALLKSEARSWFVVIAILAALFAVVGTKVHDRLPQKLQVVQVEVRPSWQGTFDIAAAVYKNSGALFGSGPNTFVRQWGLFKPAGVNETAFWNADFAQAIGFIPTTFITLGIAGILAWLLFFGAFIWETVRTTLRSMNDRSVEPIVVGLFGGALFLWILLFFYPPGPVIITLAFLTTGLALSWATHSGLMPVKVYDVRGMGSVGRLVFYLLLAVSMVAMLGAGALLSRSIVSDMYVNRSVVIFNRTGDVAQAQASLANALIIQPTNNRAHRASVELGIIQLGALAQQQTDDVETLRAQLQETIASAIQHGLSAVGNNPNDYENWLTLARAYEQLVGAQVEGAYENAEQAYRNAIAANPTNPIPNLLLARLALAREDVKAATEQIDQAIAKKQNYAEAYFLRSQINAAQGDVQGAINAAILAAQSAPQEPVAWFQLGVLLYGQGDYERSAAALEQAVLLNNNYANALYVLALAYVELGATDEATRLLEQVLILNPNNENVKGLIQALKAAADTPSETAVTDKNVSDETTISEEAQ